MNSRVGSYELVRPLGAGGMAQTFVAVRTGPADFQQRVCVKRILPELTRDLALVEQFLDEARLLARLRHANIVQVYDFGEADGSYFMALELIEGADLELLVRYLRAEGRELPATVTLHIVSEVLKALHYAHNAQLDGEPLHLVHRDISPSNVLLSRHGEVKLADFGIAKSRHRKHKTQAGYIKGKVAYMSPEQVRGEELDGRSDLFAVGVMLYELLTGVHPFDAPTDMTLLSNILTGNRPSLTSLVPDLRSDLVALVDGLLSIDPAARPATAADALRLVPSLEQPFLIERQIAELIVECVADRDKRSVQPRAATIPSSPGSTLELATPAAPRPSTGSLGNTPAQDLARSQNSLQLEIPDDFDFKKPRSSTSAPLMIGLLVAGAVGIAAWFGYQHFAGKDIASLTPSTPSTQSVPVTPEPSAPTGGESKSEARDVSRPDLEADDEAAVDREPREAIILHSPDSERPSRARARAPRARETSSSNKPSKQRRAPDPVPEVKATEGKTEAAPPPLQKPAPAVPRPKHRTGVSVSADEF